MATQDDLTKGRGFRFASWIGATVGVIRAEAGHAEQSRTETAEEMVHDAQGSSSAPEHGVTELAAQVWLYWF